jgi:hypothetical protein
MLPSPSSDTVQVLGYLAAGAACATAARREPRRADGRPGLWWGLAAVFAMLAFARLGDVGDRLAALGRGEARRDGWYSGRRGLQRPVTAMVAAAGASVALALVASGAAGARGVRRALPVITGIMALVSFVAVRAISLHEVDTVLARTVRGRSLDSLAELVLIVWCVAAATWAASMPVSRRRVS